MSAVACQAAEFLRAPGPARVPLRACCAAAVIRAATAPSATGLSSAPFVCAGAGLTMPADTRRTADPAAAGLTMAADPATAGAAVGHEDRGRRVDTAVVAEQVP